MSRYFFSILFLLLTTAVSAQTDTVVKGAIHVPVSDSVLLDSKQVSDTVQDDTTYVPAIDTTLTTDSLKIGTHKDSLHQARLGVDIGKFLLNTLAKDSQSVRKGYELQLDYYYKNDLYLVLEGGWGRGSVDYADLKYSTSNVFFKAGVDKNILLRLHPKDWDMAFIGVRYAIGLIKRSDAYYETFDPFWGKTAGTIAGKNITGHWFEITAGTRLEIYKGIFAGWNIRGKFRMNRKPFLELPPYYIAGYGKGDKNSIFDFNFYICYALRWQNR